MTEETIDDQDQPQPDAQVDAQADPLDELRREKDAMQDRLLRTAADFDNYRKRMEREKRELSDHIRADVLKDMLPIVDNFERALAAGTETESFGKGVELIYRQMLDFLKKRGVTPIEALGADFDPNFHQAVIHETSDAHREGEVMEELQRGYMLGDRLLRPAMVKVAKAA